MWQCICIQCIQGGAYWSEGVWRWKKEAGYNRSGNTRWAGTVKGKKRGKCVGEKPSKTIIYSIMMVSCHFFAPKMAHTISMNRKLSQRKIDKNPIIDLKFEGEGSPRKLYFMLFGHRDAGPVYKISWLASLHLTWTFDSLLVLWWDYRWWGNILGRVGKPSRQDLCLNQM